MILSMIVDGTFNLSMIVDGTFNLSYVVSMVVMSLECISDGSIARSANNAGGLVGAHVSLYNSVVRRLNWSIASLILVLRIVYRLSAKFHFLLQIWIKYSYDIALFGILSPTYNYCITRVNFIITCCI